MRHTSLIFGTLLGIVAASPTAFASWEAVSGTLNGGGSSGAINYFTPVALTQYSYASGSSPWEYFAFNVDNPGRTRSLIVLSDLSDRGIQKTHAGLLDAYKPERKLRWFRNSGAATATTGGAR